MSESLTMFPRPGPQPRVAIVAMSFNQGAFVDECLDSIARQEYPELEVLAVDHASTDPWSVETMRSAAARHGFRFLDLEDRGAPGPARNAAVGETGGELVLFVDADDVLLPGAVARLVDQLLAAPPDVGFVYPRIVLRGRGPEFPVPAYNLYVLLLANYCNTGSLWDRRCFDAGPGFPADTALPHEDWQLALRLGAAGVRGERAHEPTTLFRRHGFTRMQRAELDTRRYARVAAAHPHLYATEAFAAIKRRWAPALSIVAARRDPECERLLGDQACQDVELIGAGEEPRGGLLLFVGDRGGEFLARRELAEQLVRTFRAQPELPAVVFHAEPGRYPFEPVREAPRSAPAAVAVRAMAAAGTLRGAEAPVDPAAVADALAERHAPRIALRWWPGGDDGAAGDGGTRPTGDVALARDGDGVRTLMGIREHLVPLLPGTEGPFTPDGPAAPERSDPPLATVAIQRWLDPATGERRVLPAHEPAPHPFVLERPLGHLWRDDRVGVVALRRDGSLLTTCASPGEAFAFAEPCDLQGLDELVVVALPDGRRTLAAGAADPLRTQTEERSLGWIEPAERHPPDPVGSEVFLDRMILVRDVGDDAHRYTLTPTPPASPGELVLGLLLTRPRPGTRPVYGLTRDGALAGLVERPAAPEGRPGAAAAARWLAAPLRWRGAWTEPGDRRAGLARWRARRLLRGPERPTVGDRPVGHIWTEDGPGRVALHGAAHPVTGDHLLSLYEPEAQDWGYRPASVLGYLETATPARLGDYGRHRPWCSRAGRRVRP